MADGFVKLHRSILDTQWVKKPSVLSTYIYLLLRAAHEPVKVGEVELQVGQALVSIKAISESTGLSMQQVRTALDILESTNKITKTATKRYTLVTIENWALEQSAKKKATKTSTKTATTNKNNNLSLDKLFICDLEKITEKWNSLGLTQVKKLVPGSERYKHLNKRIEEYGLDAVLEALDNVRDSEFLTGKKTDFEATFDWFIAPRNFLKVYEGNYNNRKPADVPEKPKIRF